MMRMEVSLGSYTSVILGIAGLALGSPAVRAQVKIPGADWGLCKADAMREKALAAEGRQDWAEALTCWERVIDRSISTRAQRLEAYQHIYSFRGKVKPLNTDPAKARPWPTLVVAFKSVDYAWDNGKQRFVSHLTADDEKEIRQRAEAFASYVFEFTDGVLTIEPDYLFIEEPLRKLQGTGPFCCPPTNALPLIEKALKGSKKRYEHTLVYTKFVGDDGKVISPPFIADTGGGGPGGASYMDYPFFPKNYSGQPGEVELHEFLHPVDMMFNDVVGYPDTIVRNPDEGSGDSLYKRVPGEVGIVSLYEYVFRVRYTRLMWSELAQQEPKEFFWGGPNLCDWLVLGPFAAPAGSDPLEPAFIAEDDTLQPAEGAELAGRRWTHARSRGGVIDLAGLFDGQKNAVAYLATSQRICGTYDLHTGANGGVKAWLNGKLVKTVKGSRDFAFNQEKAPITFKPGYVQNLFLFKVQSSEKGWKFQARVAGENMAIPWGSQHALPGAK